MFRTLVVGVAIVLCSAIPSGAQSFDGNYCLDDCEGHKAGFEWAEENGISSSSDCLNHSSSFEEGCNVYLENPSYDADYDDDGNEIPD